MSGYLRLFIVFLRALWVLYCLPKLSWQFLSYIPAKFIIICCPWGQMAWFYVMYVFILAVSSFAETLTLVRGGMSGKPAPWIHFVWL